MKIRKRLYFFLTLEKMQPGSRAVEMFDKQDFKIFYYKKKISSPNNS